MEVQVLGPLRARSEGGFVSLRPVERRLLGALVVLDPSPGRYDTLAEAVWGDAVPRSLIHSLQTHVLRVRAGLGPACIETVAGGYRLGDAVAVDIEDFEARARACSAGGDGASVEAWDRTLAIWRGDPFDELGDWPPAVAARAGLVELWQRVVEDRCAALLASSAGDAIAEAEALVNAEPLREHRWSLLMRALDAGGRRADALRAFDRARRVLASELGISPGRELSRLFESLLVEDPEPLAAPGQDGRAGTALAGAARGAQPSAAITGSLPLFVSSFVGRDAALADLGHRAERHRVLTLVGPGGVGKTRLAIQAAAELSSRFADGAEFVDLSAVSATAVVPATAAALRLDIAGRLDHGAVAGALQDRRMLIVLDNADSGMDEVAALVAAIVRVASGVTVLTTSREPLSIDGEQVVPVAPLDDRAIELFVDRASAVRPSLELTTQREVIRALCRRVDGLPLAVELAAARCATLTPAEVLERLDSHPWVLAWDRRDVPERHRTMWATIDSSYDSLDADERMVFNRLSIFANACTIDAAQAVTARAPMRDAVRVAEVLASLARKSLITVIAGTPTRFGMLNTIRAYGRDQLARTADGDQTANAHTAWCRRLAAIAGDGLRGPDEVACHRRIEDALDELRSAVARARDDGDAAAAFDIAVPIQPHAMYGLRLELVDWIESILCLPAAVEEPLAGQGAAWLALGRWLQADLAAARRWAQFALDRAARDHLAAALAYHVRGLLGDTDALALAVAHADETGDGSTAVALRAPLVLTIAASDPARARALADDAFALAQRSGQPSALASAHLSYGMALTPTDPKTAVAHFERCRVLATDIDNRMLPQMANMLSGMARAGIDARVAASATLDAVVALDRDGSHHQAAMALARAAAAVDELGAPELAARLLGACRTAGLDSSLALYRSLGILRLIEIEQTLAAEVDAGRSWSVDTAVSAARSWLARQRHTRQAP